MSTRPYVAVLMVLMSFVSLPSLVGAQGTAKAAAVAGTFKDSQLKWGPCPPFIPKGCEIAVLHGDPSKANADVFFKVPGDFTIPDHWHTSAERMVLVSGGLRVTYHGQAPMTLKPGMYAYGPGKLGHKAYCAKGDPCVLFIAFESAIDAFPTDSTPKQ